MYVTLPQQCLWLIFSAYGVFLTYVIACVLLSRLLLNFVTDICFVFFLTYVSYKKAANVFLDISTNNKIWISSWGNQIASLGVLYSKFHFMYLLTPVIKPCSRFSSVPWHRRLLYRVTTTPAIFIAGVTDTSDETFATKSACLLLTQSEH